jgi:hypothetical protein
MSIGRGLKGRVRDYETNKCLNNAVLGWAKMMHMLEEIKETLWIEIRPNSKGLEYLEGVIYKKDLELLNSLLKKYLGPAVKEPGKEPVLPKEIQKIVDALGGVRNEQSFFYRQEGNKVIYASIWPWASNPDKITLKCGEKKLVLWG